MRRKRRKEEWEEKQREEDLNWGTIIAVVIGAVAVIMAFVMIFFLFSQ
ncbi:hypothetical protein ACFL55_02875 [Candidatus Latescibacterota bacterium]